VNDNNALNIADLDGYREGRGWAEIRGLGKEPRHKPHEYWSALLAAAVNTLDEGEEFEVQTFVYVKHESPGWWDGFRVQTRPGGGG
jgi:hypothetical protein